jgi:phosphoadenosine phosphosulfate reductase
MEAAFGGPIYGRDPARCCHLRKIVPLTRKLAGFDAWISAIRRDQTPDRARAGIVEWDGKFGLVKVNPLANWTKREVWSFILAHEIPYNPLHDRGYPSIGCWPCTRAVGEGEEDRAGRWAGSLRTECGLHSSEPLIAPQSVL